MQKARLGILLVSWTDSDLPSLRMLGQLPGSWFLQAEDLQRSSHQEEVLSLFSQPISILSDEVESGRSALQRLQPSLSSDKSLTHLVVIESFEADWLSPLITFLLQAPDLSGDLICLCPLQSRAAARWQTMLGVDQDFRHCLFPSRIYRSQWLQSLHEEELVSANHLLLAALNRQADLREQKILGLSHPDSGLRGWRRLLFESHLAVASVRKLGLSPLRSSLSLSLGVFIACTPFFGLQTLLMIFLCWLLRLNFALAFLSSQISLPPFYVGVVFLQLMVGLKLLGLPFNWPDANWLEFAQNHLLAWFLGSAVVGGLASLFVGLLSFQILKKRQIQKKVCSAEL